MFNKVEIMNIYGCTTCKNEKCKDNIVAIEGDKFNPFSMDFFCSKGLEQLSNKYIAVNPEIKNLYGKAKRIAELEVELKLAIIDRVRLNKEFASGVVDELHYNNKLDAIDIAIEIAVLGLGDSYNKYKVRSMI